MKNIFEEKSGKISARISRWFAAVMFPEEAPLSA
jgi:hypothetical protein